MSEKEFRLQRALSTDQIAYDKPYFFKTNLAKTHKPKSKKANGLHFVGGAYFFVLGA